jgi:hypothetical protein
MWAAEAISQINIPLNINLTEYSNEQFKKFLIEHNACKPSIAWLGDRNYREAIEECNRKDWIQWLKNTIPDENGIEQGTKITITKGKNEKYALWHSTGIWDLPEEFVNESSIRIISKN